MSKDKQIRLGKGIVKVAEVRFLLKEPYLKGSTKKAATTKKALNPNPTLIRAVFRYNGNKLVYSTQHKIKASQWSFPKQFPRQSYSYYDELKEDLDNIQSEIISIYRSNGSIDVKAFRRLLDESLGRSESQKSHSKLTLLEFIEDYIDRQKKSEQLSPNTIKKFETVLRKLRRYSEAKKIEIDYEDINLSFKDHFLSWLYSKTKTKSANTANKDFATIKQLLKIAHEEGYHNNLIFTKDKFGVKRAKTSKIALSEGELDKLFNLKIKPHKKLKSKKISVELATKVRDWFLVAAYSSLRWGDFSKINPESIIEMNGGHFIHTWTEKTNEEVYIPINERLLSILDKYDYTSPEMSSQRFNEAIKVVCDLAGINQKVIINTNVKGKAKPKTIKKFEKISSHDGRRAWASINYSKGFPILLLMQVTGHRKESTFLSYIGISKKDMAIKLMEQMKVLKQTKLKAV